jgi:hypothetical protein
LPNVSVGKAIRAIKHEFILPFTFEQVLLGCIPDTSATNYDPSITNIKTVKFYNHEEVSKIFKEKGDKSLISEFKTNICVNHSDLTFGSIFTPRTATLGIGTYFDSEKKTVIFQGKPHLRENTKFLESSVIDVVKKKGSTSKLTKAIPMFDWFFYFFQKVDEKKTIYTQIHLMNVGGWFSNGNQLNMAKKILKSMGEKTKKNLFNIPKNIPDTAKISDFKEKYSKLNESGVPLDGSGMLLISMNID